MLTGLGIGLVEWRTSLRTPPHFHLNTAYTIVILLLCVYHWTVLFYFSMLFYLLLVLSLSLSLISDIYVATVNVTVVSTLPLFTHEIYLKLYNIN